MVATLDIYDVGPRFDCGIDAGELGAYGLFLKPGTFGRAVQDVRRNDVIAALTQSFSDRDIAFWTRVTQSDWSAGEGQQVFDNTSQYREGHQIDVSQPGSLRLTDEPRSLFTSGSNVGRGAVVVGGNVFMAWSNGLYATAPWNNLTAGWTTFTVPMGFVSDIYTDGLYVYFVGSFTGVWRTPGYAPANALQYDAGGNGPYSRIVYDPLRKNLYAIAAAVNGYTVLHKINPGGAPTVIFDFVTGHLSSIEYHNGDILVAWASYPPTNFAPIGLQDSAIYAYNGSTMVIFADIGDGAAVGPMKSHLGSLYLEAYQINFTRINFIVPSSGPEVLISAYVISGDTVALIGPLDDPNPSYISASGQFVHFGAYGYCWRFDTVTGGLSRVYGTDAVIDFGAVEGLVSVWDGQTSTIGPTLLALTRTAGGAIWALADAVQGSLSNVAGARKLTSSRMDGGLPYVDKYIDSFQVLLDGLVAGEQLGMEFSLDDGVTWTACANTTQRPNPLTTAGTKRTNFDVSSVNPHALYRIQPTAKVGGHGPTVHAVALRFVSANPDLKMWQFTVAGFDDIRNRGNGIEDTYAKDVLAFLFAVAAANQTVLFYEPNDPTRTAHICWVQATRQGTYNTGNTYNPNRNEGEVDVVLWEVEVPA